VRYFVAGCLIVMMGLASRRFASALPAFVAEYAGDTLWAAMVFVAIGWMAAEWSSARVAIATLLVSYAVEASQFYHAPWIDAVRATTPGGLALGYGFLWSDIACYTAGVALCVVMESLVRTRRVR
jgi:hypothetical protein